MKEIQVLISEEQINKRLDELAEQLTEEYKGKDIIFLCILKGSVFFSVELAKRIKNNIQFEFIEVSSYEGHESTGKIKLNKDITGTIEGKDVIIIEDIVDTGLTIKRVMELLGCRGATSVEVVTLFDKKEGRTVKEVNPKYIGFDVPKKFVVGFGLDYNEIYRNLPYVGVLRRSVYEK